MSEHVDAELEKAREALADARILNENDGSTAGVVNRVYYAAFHAAQAVLSERGNLPEDEDHVPSHFAEDVVMVEEIPMEEAQFLNSMRAYRKKADYEHETVELDLDAKIVRAERFVDEMTDFC
ncbi:HEPN domain-containing protein [Natronomonas sp. CBA1123]|jgi:uncharacterized protein (UPF0332 family)|uniref:HEPN domain-containing protein n=1 Tax=Natronomonas sp. CBA1123 TaxID=2668070 RepID=UPI0012EAF3FA|nr:HEPN domain-containing protein [Natronomonas sp. CBA1123]MUV86864.1 HEPN domain-containing protein [Natronomonas sp. CBA1123]